MRTAEVFDMKPAVLGQTIFYKSLIFHLILSHINEILAAAGFEVVDHAEQLSICSSAGSGFHELLTMMMDQTKNIKWGKIVGLPGFDKAH